LQAYQSGGQTLQAIGNHFGLHYSRVSRIVSRAISKTRPQLFGFDQSGDGLLPVSRTLLASPDRAPARIVSTYMKSALYKLNADIPLISNPTKINNVLVENLLHA